MSDRSVDSISSSGSLLVSPPRPPTEVVDHVQPTALPALPAAPLTAARSMTNAQQYGWEHVQEWLEDSDSLEGQQSEHSSHRQRRSRPRNNGGLSRSVHSTSSKRSSESSDDERPNKFLAGLLTTPSIIAVGPSTPSPRKLPKSQRRSPDDDYGSPVHGSRNVFFSTTSAVSRRNSRRRTPKKAVRRNNRGVKVHPAVVGESTGLFMNSPVRPRRNAKVRPMPQHRTGLYEEQYSNESVPRPHPIPVDPNVLHFDSQSQRQHNQHHFDQRRYPNLQAYHSSDTSQQHSSQRYPNYHPNFDSQHGPQPRPVPTPLQAASDMHQYQQYGSAGFDLTPRPRQMIQPQQEPGENYIPQPQNAVYPMPLDEEPRLEQRIPAHTSEGERFTTSDRRRRHTERTSRKSEGFVDSHDSFNSRHGQNLLEDPYNAELYPRSDQSGSLLSHWLPPSPTRKSRKQGGNEFYHDGDAYYGPNSPLQRKAPEPLTMGTVTATTQPPPERGPSTQRPRKHTSILKRGDKGRIINRVSFPTGETTEYSPEQVLSSEEEELDPRRAPIPMPKWKSGGYGVRNHKSKKKAGMKDSVLRTTARIQSFPGSPSNSGDLQTIEHAGDKLQHAHIEELSDEDEPSHNEFVGPQFLFDEEVARPIEESSDDESLLVDSVHSGPRTIEEDLNLLPGNRSSDDRLLDDSSQSEPNPETEESLGAVVSEEMRRAGDMATNVKRHDLDNNDEMFERLAVIIQTRVRSYLTRQNYYKFHTAASTIQRRFRAYSLRSLTCTLKVDGPSRDEIPQELSYSVERVRQNTDPRDLAFLLDQCSALQRRQYFEYHSYILSMLQSKLDEMDIRNIDFNSTSVVNIKKCVKLLRQHEEYHRFHRSMIIVQGSIRHQVGTESPQSVTVIEEDKSPVEIADQIEHYAKINNGVVLLQALVRGVIARRAILLARFHRSSPPAETSIQAIEISCVEPSGDDLTSIDIEYYLKIGLGFTRLQAVVRSVQCRKMCQQHRIAMNGASIKIQARARAYIEVGNYRRTLRKIMRLQARVRGMFVRSHGDADNTRILDGITAFQAKVRGAIGRSIYEQKLLSRLRNSSAVTIQSALRTCLARNRYIAVRAAIITLQCRVRGIQARASAMRRLLETQSAILIQSVFRGIKQKVSFKKTESGFVALQSRVRSRIATRTYLQMFYSAIRIQSLLRGNSARRRHKAILLTLHMNTAALAIQTSFRSFSELRRYSALRAGVIKLQACIRRMLTQRTAKRYRNSAIVLQSTTRAFVARAKFNLVKSGLVALQSQFRRSRVIPIAKQSKAATAIQASTRSWLSRVNLTREETAQAEESHLNAAARMIQSSTLAWLARRRVTRSHLAEQECAATRIQAVYRAWQCQSYFFVLTACAARIQRLYRQHRIAGNGSGQRRRAEFERSIRRSILLLSALKALKSRSIVDRISEAKEVASDSSSLDLCNTFARLHLRDEPFNHAESGSTVRDEDRALPLADQHHCQSALDQAVVTIQIRWRDRLQLDLTSRKSAATTIQSLARMKRCQALANEMKADAAKCYSAVRIQAAARSWICRLMIARRMGREEQAARRHAAAVDIQSIVRSRQCQRLFARYRYEQKRTTERSAAIMIQRFARTICCKKMLLQRAETRLEVNSAIAIQSAVRGMIIRNSGSPFPHRSLDSSTINDRLGTEEVKIISIAHTLLTTDGEDATESIDNLGASREDSIRLLQRVIRGHIARQKICIANFSATRIQRFVRSSVEVATLPLHRKYQADLIAAVTTLQQRWRSSQCDRIARREYCSIRLQSIVRSKLCRNKLALASNSATKIQSSYRRYRVESRNEWASEMECDLKRQVLSAILIQSAVRSRQSRFELHRLQADEARRIENFAATMIQSFARMRRCRSIMLIMRRDLLEARERSAVGIQAIARMHLAQSKFDTANKNARIIQLWWKDKRELSISTKNEFVSSVQRLSCLQRQFHHASKSNSNPSQAIDENTSARTIQANARQWLARNELSTRRDEHERRAKATITIQSVVRSHQSHLEVTRRREACARKTLVIRSDAATKIQSILRVRQSRMELLDRRSKLVQLRSQSAVLIQRQIRTYTQAHKFDTANKNARIIQLWWKDKRALSRSTKNEFAVAVNRTLYLKRQIHLLASRPGPDSNETAIASAVVLIQSLVRSRQSYMELLRRRQAREDGIERMKHFSATLIQSAARARKCSKEVSRLRHDRYRARQRGAVLLQAAVRMHIVKSEYFKIKSAATTANNAAVKVQALVRRALIRHELAAFTLAASAIQSCWAKYLLRLPNRQRLFVTMIQSMSLIQAERKEAQSPVVDVLLPSLAASVKLQAFVRGSLVRNQLLKLTASAVVIQSCWASYAARLPADRTPFRSAGLRIKNFLLMKLAQKRLHKLRNSSMRIQSFYRGVLMRREFCDLSVCAIIIQRTWQIHKLSPHKRLRRSDSHSELTRQLFRQSIQSVHEKYRGGSTTRRVELLYLSWKMKRTLEMRNDSSISIQRFARGFLTRQSTNATTRARTDQHLAAQSILLADISITAEDDCPTLDHLDEKVQPRLANDIGEDSYTSDPSAHQEQIVLIQAFSRQRFVLTKKAHFDSHARVIQAFWRRNKTQRSITSASFFAHQSKFCSSIGFLQKKSRKEKHRRLMACTNGSAIVIQSTYRSYRQRRKLAIVTRSATVIQRQYRQFRAVSRMHAHARREIYAQSLRQGYESSCATKIQSVIRMRMGRLRLYDKRADARRGSAILLIQSASRMWQVRCRIRREQQHANLVTCATRIQSAARMRMSRNVLRDRRKQMLETIRAENATKSAVLCLQSATRMWLCRHELSTRRERTLQMNRNARELAAIRIQSAIRSAISQLELIRLKKEHEREMATRQNSAATLIQSIARSRHGRLLLAQARRDHERRENAATVIQCALRYCRARTISAQLSQDRVLEASRVEAAITIQSYARARRCEIEYGVIKARHKAIHAAISIQSVARSFMHRRRYISRRPDPEPVTEDDIAAIKVQSAARGFILRTRLDLVNRAATIIQRSWRRCVLVLRKKLLVLLDAVSCADLPHAAHSLPSPVKRARALLPRDVTGFGRVRDVTANLPGRRESGAFVQEILNSVAVVIQSAARGYLVRKRASARGEVIGVCSEETASVASVQSQSIAADEASFSCDSLQDGSYVPMRLSTDEENELLILHPIYLRAQARADELLAKLDGDLDRLGILELDE